MKTFTKINFLPIIIGVISIPAIFVVIILLWYQSLLTPLATSGDKVPFEVKAGESGAVIADRLKKVHLIKSTLAFRLYAKQHGFGTHISEGIFYLSPSMAVPEIAEKLTGSGEVDVKVTFIEGWRNEQFAEILADKMQIDMATFLDAAKLGYMFPDTYQFNKKETVPDIVGTLQATFDQKLTPTLRVGFAKQLLSLDQAITLASIVERESHDSIPTERQMIASVLLKRLHLGMPLQADATMQFALGYDQYQKTWWRELSLDDLKKPSPYNTYLHTGLPPGPICNPGIKSMQGVVEAVDTPYLYYIHGKDGQVHFAKTLEEHNLNQQRYL